MADSAPFVLSILEHARGGRIAFDEFHHGEAAMQATGAAAVFDGPVGVAAALATVVVLAFLAVNGRRLGRPQPAGITAVPTTVTYVDAMARLLRRSHGRGVVAARYAAELKERLGALTGVDANLDDAAFTAALAALSTPRSADVAALLQRARGLSEGDVGRSGVGGAGARHRRVGGDVERGHGRHRTMARMTQTAELRATLHDMFARAVVGQRQVIDGMFIAVLVGGHVLLEGVPGTAKTLMARTLAAALDARFTRVQFTPDLLPSDILGTSVFRQDTSTFEFRPGPLFTDTMLADEINRAPAKTQAALLEAMEERQVTLDGHRMPLGNRFLVIATQNPVEYEGTYPLPEAQLDRFLFKLDVPVPDVPTEVAMLRRFDVGFDPHDLQRAGIVPVIDAQALQRVRDEVSRVRVGDEVLGYIAAIVAATRTSPDLMLGASPRGSIGLLLGAKAMAAIAGRDYVVPDDVKEICIPALRHRMVRRPESELQGVSEVAAVQRAVARVPVPR